MIRTLIKKELLELVCSFFRSRTNGKKSAASNTGRAVLLVFLFLFVAGYFGFLFYNVALGMNLSLAGTENGHLAFTVTSLTAFGFGLIGTAFACYTALYNAKDNDLLLSFPVTPTAVLFSRTAGIYIFTAIIEAMVTVPAEIAHIVCFGVDFLQLVLFIFALLFLPLFTFVFSALFGYLIALAAPKIRNMSLVSTVFYVLLLVFYMFIVFRFQKMVMGIAENSSSANGVFKYGFFPFFALGKGLFGSPIFFLFFALISAGAFAIVYFLLRRSFLRLATASKIAARKEYTGRQPGARSPFFTLLIKDSERLFSSMSYLLNTVMGLVFLLIAAVAQFFFKNSINEFLAQMPAGVREFFPLIVCAAVATVTGMSSVTAPSISLEGAALPLLRSFPIPERTILHSKFSLHLLAIALPGTLLHAVICVSLFEGFWTVLLSVLVPIPFFALSGVLGLIFNLKSPYLKWTNEAIAVKQSPSVLFTVLTLFGIEALTAGLAVLLSVGLSLGVTAVAAILLLFLSLLLVVFTALLEKWGPKRLRSIDEE